jgi:hypothetical protein
MQSSDTTGTERSYDDEIRAFLIRESNRRARQRPADAEVVAMIRRSRDRPWPTRMLAGAAAASLLVGLGVYALVLVLRPSTESGSSPTASSSTPAMQLPTVAAGQPCPVSRPPTSVDRQAPRLGDGPVQLALATMDGTVYFEATPGGNWKAVDLLWTASPGFEGEVVVRGARLDAPGELGFADPADPLKELRIASTEQTPTLDGHLLLASTPIRIKGAGCYGLQIDSGGRSSVVIIEARPIEEALVHLERPLRLPDMGPAVCPISSATGSVPFMAGARGDGPVYLAAGGTLSLEGNRQSGGYWFLKNAWVADPRELGPILVRGGRIDASGELRFGDGSDPARELRLPIHSYEHTSDQPPGWRLFNAYLRPPSPGCYALQLDTFAGSGWLMLGVTP